MKVSDFLKMLMKAYNSKTLYVMGGWGFPLTDSNKQRAYTNPYNNEPDRKELIKKATPDTFGFDCCGMVRSVLWGWNGDTSAKNGGAVYGANGVPEYDAKQFMFQGCTEHSDDFTKIEPGEFLWMDGHCGVYLGNGLAIESTPKWKDGVQITNVKNVCKEVYSSAYPSRTWTYHGHLKYVEYDTKYPACPFIAHNTLKGVLIRDIPYSDGKGIGYIILGSDVQIEAVEGSSGDYGKITGYVYLPGGFSHDNKPL